MIRLSNYNWNPFSQDPFFSRTIDRFYQRDPFENFFPRTSINRFFEEDPFFTTSWDDHIFPRDLFFTNNWKLQRLSFPKLENKISLNFEVKEDEKRVFINAKVPGAKKENMKVEIVGNTLKVECEINEQKENKKGNSVSYQKTFQKVSRNFNLPADVDPETLESEFEDGVLRLSLQKITQSSGKKDLQIIEGDKNQDSQTEEKKVLQIENGKQNSQIEENNDVQVEEKVELQVENGKQDLHNEETKDLIEEKIEIKENVHSNSN